jgi:4'-phosphopantetheinyl transferase
MAQPVELRNLHREAHVWFVVPETIQAKPILENCLAALSDRELQQYRRFLFDADRRRYLVSHALVRRVLSHYVQVAPADWTFSYAKRGKPEIANQGVGQLRFNLTHTAGLAACVVTLRDDCGIDAERIIERHNSLGVAKRMFSESEYKRIKELSGRTFLEEFFQRWTLREAYVKALGIGISFPTRELQFAIDDETIRVDYRSKAGADKAVWQFQLMRPTVDHIAAVAMCGEHHTEKKIVSRFFDFQDDAA